jgi:hypothetical protein
VPNLSNSWLFPVIESIHMIGLALLVGTIVVVDLRLLRGEAVSDFASGLAGWTRAGFYVMLITGPVMFLSNTSRYLKNPAFLLKMGFLFLALSWHFTMHRSATKSPAPVWPRLTAGVSVALWTLVVLGGRAIADFDIVQ